MRHNFRECRTFMFDCDGTLWTPSGLIPGAADLIDYLKKSGRQCLLITNNSSKSVEKNYELCCKLGLAVDKVDFNFLVIAAAVAAYYLSKKGIRGPVYVIGRDGLANEFDKVGISYFGIGVSGLRCGSVLVGYDPYFNYVKLMKAASFIDGGCQFFATNEDSRLPASGKSPAIINVPLVCYLNILTQLLPVIFGKPNKPIFDYIVETRNITPEQTIMIASKLRFISIGITLIFFTDYLLALSVFKLE
ncbi:unnamed protein product [Schistocephalus solidus]|uniref:4-nitrophenylphosphatase n=1 Tax=Schistocephalus solidus TaxID=70667 RepID=A0A183SEU5_SCHSO|nr:unnamed protein product [Schistocephalus solidus]